MCGNKERNDTRTSSKLPLRRRTARLPSTGTSGLSDNLRKRLKATPKTTNQRLRWVHLHRLIASEHTRTHIIISLQARFEIGPSDDLLWSVGSKVYRGRVCSV
jgi:hypothetical protein